MLKTEFLISLAILMVVVYIVFVQEQKKKALDVFVVLTNSILNGRNQLLIRSFDEG